jgi:hypothetical protein
MPIPLRSDFDAARLRRIARESENAKQVRRLLPLAAIYTDRRCRNPRFSGSVWFAP